MSDIEQAGTIAVATPRIVIAAPSSGCGKTTVAIGLMAALAAEHTVQGFKVGPDYIDPGYHAAACGRPSRNLDSWMTSPIEVQRTFARAAGDADIAIIEGAMGLFDGHGDSAGGNSTAEVAKLLHAPVILVLDVSKMAHSAGAMARGYRDYDLHVRVAAVICNNVASPRHADWTREAVEGIGLPVLGCLPRSQGFAVPERHLGLFTAAECPHELRDLLTRLGGVVRQEINLERVWQIARTAMTFPVTLAEAPPCRPRVRLAVARDEAFCFYYDDNLDLLRQAGAEIAFFSPLRDARLPEGSAGIYLGGGYPELYAASLAANLPLLQDLRRARQAGFPIYAECGGLMYLTQGILDREGRMHRLVGLLPGYCRLSERPTIGYRTARALRHSLLLLAGETVRGHEFHYSEWLGLPADPLSAYALEDAQASASRAEGWAEEGLLASYVHLHFAARPALAGRFVAACCSVADRRQPANP